MPCVKGICSHHPMPHAERSRHGWGASMGFLCAEAGWQRPKLFASLDFGAFLSHINRASLPALTGFGGRGLGVLTAGFYVSALKAFLSTKRTRQGHGAAEHSSLVSRKRLMNRFILKRWG